MEIKRSLIIPVYKNEDTLQSLLDRLVAQAPAMAMEIVFVIDGSPDGSGLLLQRRLPQCPFPSQVIFHARNFGSFAAIQTGLAHARGESMAVMAADLQESPEFLTEIFNAVEKPEVDIALGVRRRRQDPWLSRMASALFWSLYRRLIQPEMPKGGVDVFGCRVAVAQQLVQLTELNSSLVGLLLWVGYRRVEVPYDRLPRPSGRSAWTWTKRWRYLENSVFAFSELPLRLLRWIGVAGMATCVILGTAVLQAKLSHRIPVPGYAATVLVVLFFGALNCFGIGLLGSYVWRTYENTKRRPPSIVRQRDVFDR